MISMDEWDKLSSKEKFKRIAEMTPEERAHLFKQMRERSNLSDKDIAEMQNLLAAQTLGTERSIVQRDKMVSYVGNMAAESLISHMWEELGQSYAAVVEREGIERAFLISLVMGMEMGYAYRLLETV